MPTINEIEFIRTRSRWHRGGSLAVPARERDGARAACARCRPRQFHGACVFSATVIALIGVLIVGGARVHAGLQYDVTPEQLETYLLILGVLPENDDEEVDVDEETAAAVRAAFDHQMERRETLPRSLGLHETGRKMQELEQRHTELLEQYETAIEAEGDDSAHAEEIRDQFTAMKAEYERAADRHSGRLAQMPRRMYEIELQLWRTLEELVDSQRWERFSQQRRRDVVLPTVRFTIGKHDLPRLIDEIVIEQDQFELDPDDVESIRERYPAHDRIIHHHLMDRFTNSMLLHEQIFSARRRDSKADSKRRQEQMNQTDAKLRRIDAAIVRANIDLLRHTARLLSDEHQLTALHAFAADVFEIDVPGASLTSPAEGEIHLADVPTANALREAYFTLFDHLLEREIAAIDGDRVGERVERYQDVVKAIERINEHIIALGRDGS